MSLVCTLVLYINHSFQQFGTIQETGRERDKLSLFHQSQSLSLKHTQIRKHEQLSVHQSQSLSLTHTRIRKHHEQLSGQLIQFCDSAIS